MYETGRLVAYYRVTCANCGVTRDLDHHVNRESARRAARLDGWVKHQGGKQGGWHCPTCAADRALAKSQAKLQAVLRARTH